MKLNIGCGRSRETLSIVSPSPEGWKHIDVCPLYEPDECYDVTEGIREPDESVDTIWVGDVLEHFPRMKVASFLNECWRVLVKGGFLLVSTPDMEKVMPIWLADEDGTDAQLQWLIWGEQDESGGGLNAGPDTHRHGYTERSLTRILVDAGFDSPSRTSVHGVWFELAMVATKPWHWSDK